MGNSITLEKNAGQENAHANCGEECLTQQDMKDELLEMKEMKDDEQLMKGHFGDQPILEKAKCRETILKRHDCVNTIYPFPDIKHGKSVHVRGHSE